VYEVTSEGLRAVSLGNVWYSVDGGTVKIVNLDTTGRYIDLPAFFGPVITGEQRAIEGAFHRIDGRVVSAAARENQTLGPTCECKTRLCITRDARGAVAAL
jgi:hypothetical protein